MESSLRSTRRENSQWNITLRVGEVSESCDSAVIGRQGPKGEGLSTQAPVSGASLGLGTPGSGVVSLSRDVIYCTQSPPRGWGLVRASLSRDWARGCRGLTTQAPVSGSHSVACPKQSQPSHVPR